MRIALNKDDRQAQHRGSSPSIQDEPEKPAMTGMEWIQRGRQIRDGNLPPDVTIPGTSPRTHHPGNDGKNGGKKKKPAND
jgi:hypothetical protein